MKRKIDFDILESLRGFASFYVCLAHCRGVLWIGGEHYLKLHPQSSWSLSDYGLIGLNMLTRLSTEFVIIFFVLSGFSIAHSLRKRQNPLEFYKRRFVRLYPPYVTAILWAMLVTGLILYTHPQFFTDAYNTLVFDRLKVSKGLFDWMVFLKNLVYIPQMEGLLNPLWSLTHEVIFYLLAPFLFYNRRAYYLLSVLGFCAVNYAYANGLMRHHILTDFLNYNLFFAIGVFLYNNYETIVGKLSILSRKPVLFLAGGLYFAMIGISLAGYNLLNSLLAACLSVMLIVYLVNNNLRVKPLIQLGRYSYTLYITHFPTIFIYLALYYQFTGATSPYIFNNLVFIPAVFLCLGVAYLLYQLVEKRTKNILDKLRSRTEQQPELPVVPEPVTTKTS